MTAIAKGVAMLDEPVRDLLAATPHLGQRHRRLCQVTGVGAVFAAARLADLPELGRVTPKVAFRNPAAFISWLHGQEGEAGPRIKSGATVEMNVSSPPNPSRSPYVAACPATRCPSGPAPAPSPGAAAIAART